VYAFVDAVIFAVLRFDAEDPSISSHAQPVNPPSSTSPDLHFPFSPLFLGFAASGRKNCFNSSVALHPQFY
jgi:hypothetical protein